MQVQGSPASPRDAEVQVLIARAAGPAGRGSTRRVTSSLPAGPRAAVTGAAAPASDSEGDGFDDGAVTSPRSSERVGTPLVAHDASNAGSPLPPDPAQRRALGILAACALALIAFLGLRAAGGGSNTAIDASRHVVGADGSPTTPLLFVQVGGTAAGIGPRMEMLSCPDASDFSVGDVKRLLAARLGVPPAYLALFKRGPVVSASSGAVLSRLPRHRLDGAHAADSLQALGVDGGARVLDEFGTASWVPGAGAHHACGAGEEKDAADTAAADPHGARAAAAAAASSEAAAATRPLSSLGILPGDTLDALIRPLRGDHIHLGFAVYIGGRRAEMLHDRPLQGYTSEGQHVSNLFPHFGVHAGAPGWFDDGLIHIHPGTTWGWFGGIEGLGATLGAFLEQIGVVVWEPASARYPFHVAYEGLPATATCLDSAAPLVLEADASHPEPTPVTSRYDPSPQQYAANHTILCSGDELPGIPGGSLLWRAYVWWHHTRAGGPPDAVVTTGLDRLWLPYAGGMVVLSLEPASAPPGTYTYPGCDYTPPSSTAAAGSAAGGATAYPYPRAQTVARLVRDAAPPGFDGGVYPLPFVA